MTTDSLSSPKQEDIISQKAATIAENHMTNVGHEDGNSIRSSFHSSITMARCKNGTDPKVLLEEVCNQKRNNR